MTIKSQSEANNNNTSALGRCQLRIQAKCAFNEFPRVSIYDEDINGVRYRTAEAFTSTSHSSNPSISQRQNRVIVRVAYNPFKSEQDLAGGQAIAQLEEALAK